MQQCVQDCFEVWAGFAGWAVRVHGAFVLWVDSVRSPLGSASEPPHRPKLYNSNAARATGW